MAEALVTRRELAGLDPVLHDAVVGRDGGYVLQLPPGLEVPLLNSGVAVSSLVTGWLPSGQASIHFTWAGCDEMDQTSGDGDAQLEEDGTLTGNIRFDLGVESSFIARRW